MQLLKKAATALSILSLSILAACGGGGDSPNYPADGQIVINTATTSTPVGTYSTAGARAEAYEYGPGLLEYFFFELEDFYTEVYFAPNDTRKYVIVFDDSSDDYGCRSAAVSETDLSNWDLPSLPVCASTLEIDAAKRNLRASNFTIKGLENPALKVTLSANISWTLTAE